MKTLHRYSPRSDRATSEISNIPDGSTFILWSKTISCASFSHRVSTSAENEVEVRDDKDEVEVTRHSKAAICPKNTLLSSGSDSNTGDAGNEKNEIIKLPSIFHKFSHNCFRGIRG